MKIYTKGGDTGETSLFGGTRVSKDDLRIRTYGTLDELNALLGWVLTEPLPDQTQSQLRRIQCELFQLGAELATPAGKKTNLQWIEDSNTLTLEKEIDEMEEALTPLKVFILPGGSRASAGTHLARTVSRRAERELIALHQMTSMRGEVLRYLNRLSDFLFVAARFINFKSGIPDIPWVSAPKKTE